MKTSSMHCPTALPILRSRFWDAALLCGSLSWLASHCATTQVPPRLLTTQLPPECLRTESRGPLHTIESRAQAQAMGCAELHNGVDFERERVLVFDSPRHTTSWGVLRRVGTQTEVTIRETEYCGGPAPMRTLIATRIPADGTTIVLRRVHERNEQCERVRRGEIPPPQ